MRTVSNVPALCAAAALVMALGGCAGAVPGNEQGLAGVTDVKLEWCPVGADGTDYKLCNIAWKDGKEKQSVHLAADIGKGTVDYAATGVAAFDGQKVRAEVEKAVAEQVGQSVGPGGTTKIVDSIMMAVKAGLGVP